MPTLALRQNTPPSPLAGPGMPIEWSFNPWSQGAARPLATLAGSGLLIALACTSRLPLPACTALVIGIVALTAPGYLPAAFRLDGLGVSRRLAFLPWSSMSWDRVGSATLHRGALLIVPRGAAGFLATLRGWALPLPAKAQAGGARERLREWRDGVRDSHGD